ncbi:hypothetical protein ANCCAN_27304, partial [Ancylostoma caninum]
MPLYDDDDSPPHGKGTFSPPHGKGSANITMKFLQAQIAQKRVQIQQGMVNLFGEYVVKNEYQPAVPNEYIAFKRKAEEREAREKHAREIAERLELRN